MRKFNKKMVGFMIFLSIVGCSKPEESLFEYKMSKWTPSIPCCFSTNNPLYSDIDNPNDYLYQVFSERGENIFYVGGLETYNRTLNDELPGHSIRYDYVFVTNNDNGEVSDTLWRPDLNH